MSNSIEVPSNIRDMNSEELYTYLRSEKTLAISDWKQCKNYLESNDLTSDEMFIQFSQAATVHAFMEKNRPHNGTKLEPYKCYQELFPKEPMGRARFNEVYQIVSCIMLDRAELTCDTKCLKAISEWREVGERDEYIFEYISSLQRHPSITDLENLHARDTRGVDPKARHNAFVSAAKLLRKHNYMEDAVCAAYLNNELNDILLENCVIFYKFSSTLPVGKKDPLSVLIISPNPFFVKKWFLDESLEHVNVVFAMENPDICDTFKSRYKKYSGLVFLTLEELPSYLRVNKSPDYSMLFANRLSNLTELVTLLKDNAKGTHHLTCFGADSTIVTAGRDYENLWENVIIESVTLLPSGILNATPPQRKMIVQAEYGYLSASPESYIDIFSYSLCNEETQFLRKKAYIAKIDAHFFESGNGSIRDAYRRQEIQAYAKTALKRKRAEKYQFSNEITINYTVSNEIGKPDLYRAEAYIRRPFFENGMTKNGEKILESVFRKRSVTKDKIEEWIEDVYPYEIRLRGQWKGASVQQVVGPVFRNAYSGKPLSLKTFLYLYPEISEGLAKVGRDRLLEIARGDLGAERLDQLTQEFILDELDKMYSQDESGRELQQATYALSFLFDCAVKEKQCQDNPIKSLFQTQRWQKTQIRIIRSNLAKKSFTPQEAQFVVKRLTEKKGGQPRGILVGLLIRFLMGLDSNIVSALKWKDFREVGEFSESYRFYQLSVRRQLSNDGTSLQPFQKAYSYRILPCPKMLANFLLAEKIRQTEDMHLSEDGLLELPIVQEAGKKESAGVQQAVPPTRLSKAGKKLIQQMHLPENLIEIPNDANGTVESNLAFYGGDLFSSNFRHYCMSLCGFDEGEYAYWNGSQAPSTFSRNYCDYANPASQLILLCKIERWISTLKSEKNQNNSVVSTFEGVRKIDVTSDGFATSRTDVEVFLTTDMRGAVSFHAESNYGFDMSISPERRIKR